jgi:beta-N-acetylhexosaminidase
LSPPLEWRPPLAELVAKSSNKAELLTQVETYGRQQGKELAQLGVTVNFSPVVDLQSNNVQDRLDFHSLINKRAISHSPEQTIEVALAYGRGLQSQGVLPTLKHFPGLGGVRGDTHHFSVTLDTPIEELASHDWLPFQRVALQSKALIMLGHVVLSQVDKDNPVSISRAVVQKIIRGAWKHEGLLITDDLTMAAAYNYGLCQATVKSLNAGVDLLLLSYDYEKFYEAMYCAVAAYKNGTLEENQLERSSKRFKEFSISAE